jgi:hypothetical protein
VTALLVTAADRRHVRADERFRRHFRVVYGDRHLDFYELVPRP